MVTPFVIWALHELTGLSWGVTLASYALFVAVLAWAFVLVRRSRRGSLEW
jgi:hypothetical protein